MRWNGYKAALSLTFDDGLPCQLEHAIPAMDERGIRGTFFLPSCCREYPLDLDAWKEVAAHGHEIGSHSVTHRKAASLSPIDLDFETRYSRSELRRQLHAKVDSFCYPYTDAPHDLQKAVQVAGYKQARGGRVARADKYIVPGDGANLFNVPAYHVSWKSFLPEVPEDHVYDRIDEAISREAWVVFMFHGVGPDRSQWDNVQLPEFTNLLTVLKSLEINRQLWTAPFGTVAEYLRGLK